MKKSVTIIFVLAIISSVILKCFDFYCSKYLQQIYNTEISKSQAEPFFEFSELKISTIGFGPSITFIDPVFKDQSVIYIFEEVKIGTSYLELLNLLKSVILDDLSSYMLNSFSVNLTNLSLDFIDNSSELSKMGWDLNKHILIDNVYLNFKGALNEEIVMGISKGKIDRTQSLFVSIEGLNCPEIVINEFLKELDIPIQNISNSSIDYQYTLKIDPSNNQLIISDFMLNTPIGEQIANITLDYVGSNLESLTITKITANFNAEYDYDETVSLSKDFSIQLGKGEANGEFIMSNLDKPINDEIYFLKNFDGKFDFYHNDFNIYISDYISDKLENNLSGSKLEDNQLIFSNIAASITYDDLNPTAKFKIKSSLADVIGYVDLSLIIDKYKTWSSRYKEKLSGDSRINSIRVEIKKISPTLESYIRLFEEYSRFGKLPRKGGNIDLNISGTLSSPYIDGMNF